MIIRSTIDDDRNFHHAVSSYVKRWADLLQMKSPSIRGSQCCDLPGTSLGLMSALDGGRHEDAVNGQHAGDPKSAVMPASNEEQDHLSARPP